MRKKSHIALSVYLTSQLRNAELERHKKAFYLGSILPDLSPKMVTDPHEFDSCWLKIQILLRRLEAEAKSGRYQERILWRQAGVALHYLADFFTYPHNTCFPGSLKDHCIYESELKYALRAFLRTQEARQILRTQQKRAARLRGAGDLIAYIEESHARYMQADHTAPDDCRWIVEVCSLTLFSLAESASIAEEEFWMHSHVA